MQNDEGRVAIISGGGSGIGRATAIRLAQAGLKVCLLDLKEERAEKVAQAIQEQGGEAFVADVDVSDPNRVRQGVEYAAEKWGRVDVVFANAGINGKVAPIEVLEPEDWNQTLSTNLNSTFYLVKYSLPYLKKQGGAIVITSSINGNRQFSNIGMSAYSTSKAGQVAFMKMAALELAKYKIRVNAICPGAIETNIGQNTEKTKELKEVEIPVKYPKGQHPLSHSPGQPEQVAELVYFLAGEASSHITGTEVYIDGAESLLT
jgi:NAD(P)-dependent dehydrogenase (short-subunit alcohol dehydrogenase family)